MLSRDTGHSRVPAPPHMITGTMRDAAIRRAPRDGPHHSRQTSMPAGRAARIERALDVHHEAAAVLQQPRDQRPARRHGRRRAPPPPPPRRRAGVRRRLSARCRIRAPRPPCRRPDRGPARRMPNSPNSLIISTTCELRMSTTFSLNVSPSTVTRPVRDPARCEPLHAFARNPHADRIVDAPPGQDHVGMIAGFLRPIGQIIRIDADAVAADQARA